MAQTAQIQELKEQDEAHQPVRLHLHRSEEMKAVQPRLFEVIDVIRKYSPLGRRFLEAAEKHEVGFLKRTFNTATGGSYVDSTVQSSHENSLEEDVGAVIIHELMHWNQPEIRIGPDWDGRTRLLSTLAKESGAQTCAIRSCYEMKLNGYTDAFNHFACPYSSSSLARTYGELYRIFDRAYRHSVTEGKDHANSLLDAGDATFNAYFRQTNLTYSYGVSVLKSYIEHVVYHAQKQHPVPSFGLVSAKNQARISKDEYLIHAARLPLKDSELFNENDLLRQALDYVEACQIRNYVESDTNLSLHRKINAMREDDNPFFNVSLKKVWYEYKPQSDVKDRKNILEIMMDVAGKPWPKRRQLSFDFTAPHVL